MIRFPERFIWGAATSAYQIEGGITEDGRGSSIWDDFCTRPGRIRGGDNGETAADHRHRMSSDVALMAELGLNAYRFSIAWPRVQPLGSGPTSSSGLDFYEALVDMLLTNEIEPFVTLYHWDLPSALDKTGGWPTRETAYRFAEYAHLVGNRLGDRVRHWTTINEPWCASMLGYCSGAHAPGISDAHAAVRAAHHLLLGHGLAVTALHDSVGVDDMEIGITLNPYPVVAASTTAQELDVARRVDGVANRLWYDAILKGSYPSDVLADFESVGSSDHINDGDLAYISQPIDALGINYYRRYHTRHEPGASASGLSAQWPGSENVGVVEPNVTHTDGGWAIEPDGLKETLERVRDEYPPVALYIHENGAAFDDGPMIEGIVQDPKRTQFIADHLRAAHAAIQTGCDLRGYFVWSLFDNFEWTEGYSNRFGIIHVDFSTLVRTFKSSALFYSSVMKNNGFGPA